MTSRCLSTSPGDAMRMLTICAVRGMGPIVAYCIGPSGVIALNRSDHASTAPAQSFGSWAGPRPTRPQTLSGNAPNSTLAHRPLVVLRVGPILGRLTLGARLVALSSRAHASSSGLLWPARAGCRWAQERPEKGLCGL